MSRIVKDRWVETTVSYGLEFDRGDTSGFRFPCDEHGTVSNDMPTAAINNYLWCLQHPEEFKVYGKVVKCTHNYKHGALLECDCGETFELWNAYMGACYCEKCGQWYNVFGQKLLDPEYWEENY